MSGNAKILVTTPGDITALQTVTEAMPVPGRHEVRIKVLAAGAAYGDVYLRRGIGYSKSKYPLVPGYDVVGITLKLFHGRENDSSNDNREAPPLGLGNWLSVDKLGKDGGKGGFSSLDNLGKADSSGSHGKAKVE